MRELKRAAKEDQRVGELETKVATLTHRLECADADAARHVEGMESDRASVRSKLAQAEKLYQESLGVIDNMLLHQQSLEQQAAAAEESEAASDTIYQSMFKENVRLQKELSHARGLDVEFHAASESFC